MLMRLFIYPKAILIIRLFLTIFMKVKLSTYFHLTGKWRKRNVTHANHVLFYWEVLKKNAKFHRKTGSRRVFSECRVWAKYSAGFGKTQNFRRNTGFDRSSGSGHAKILAWDALLGKKTVFGIEMTYVRDAACVRDFREKGAGKRDEENPLPHLNSLFHFISFHFYWFIQIYNFFFSLPSNSKGFSQGGQCLYKTKHTLQMALNRDLNKCYLSLYTLNKR